MSASAQYYSWGASPSSIKWKRIKTDSIKLIYPDYWQPNAGRTLFYFDTIRHSISYGFSRPPARVPVIMQTQNMNSNGVVTYAPKRIELMSFPDVDDYAQPWMKHLVAHEYRHSVQYNNLNRSTVRSLSILLGDQGLLIGTLLMPLWFMEGDAVMAETQMTTFGRAMQPSFSMEYRAIGRVKTPAWQIDRWFCGSFKYNIPDHYKMGYQMTRYSYERYGQDFWNKLIRYTSNFPFLIVPRAVAMQKYYKTSVNKLFYDTFDSLNDYWDSLPRRNDSATLYPLPAKTYTKYTFPMFRNDSTIVAFKENFDRTTAIVSLDVNTATEKVLCYIGKVSTRPVISGDRIYWTEFRYSTVWDEKVNSRLCFYNFNDGTKHCATSSHQVFYPTATGYGPLSYVSYNYDGTYSIREGMDIESRCYNFASGVEIHGMAWDDVTRRLYFIGLSEQGEWIGALRDDRSGYDLITPPRFITVSNLRADNGVLYFGSIVSGVDEAHSLDLISGEEYRLTESRFGSFSPSPSPSGDRVVVTSYDRLGYHLAVQNTATKSVQPYRDLPVNLVNPPTRKWNVTNLDSVRYNSDADSAAYEAKSAKRYHKGLTLLNAHSWAPFEFDPFNILSDNQFDINLGATILSQNLLSSMTAYASWGWSRLMGNRFRIGVEYSGWGPTIAVAGTYGGGNQMVYNRPATVPMPDIKPALNLSVSVSQPLWLSSGATFRRITPQIGFSFSNDLVYTRESYQGEAVPEKGVFRLSGSLSYVEQMRLAHRDFMPRWGYALKVSFVDNPINADFRTSVLAYARGYLPGFAPHHSTSIQLGYQASLGNKRFGFRVKELFPRGAEYDFTPKHYMACAVDYRLPVAYPDWGIPSVLFIRRIRLGVFGDYARYQTFDTRWHNLFSYGGNVTFDVVPICLPSNSNTEVTVTVAKPSDRSGVTTYVTLSLPL